MDTEKKNNLLRIGHSPDADDAFMFYALAKGFVKIEGFEIEHVIKDIQTLNQKALKGELEMTAISAAVYPTVAKNYWILSCGASVGRNYGPIVVAKEKIGLNDLIGKRIAVPGRDTTAFLLLSLFLDKFESVPFNFDKVIPAVQEGKVDAGLVIHEGQIDFPKYGLQKIVDLGEVWYEKHKLPIPLGLDIVKKDLGFENAKRIQNALYESILYSMEHENEALNYSSQFGRGVVGDTLKRFVEMYVNKDTINLGEEGKKALETFYQEAAQKGFCKPISQIEVI